MANSEHTSGRILWLDPNKANNTMVNPEDLSIKVEFSTYRKGRSIIYSGRETTNSGGRGATVNFIDGSKVNNTSAQNSLTTRYTEAIALEVMNQTDKSREDFESLGIESIDIEFNTAFTPLIKIKFIDVRGNAILSQGSMSKYNVFFELPYPIFNLKIKGFYGKTVSYCLHMQRWNAAFNSDTGNFEIQADFMGYTYAMLTDILIGLVRAAVRTKRGQEKLKKVQESYEPNDGLIITIDEMMKNFIDLNNTFNKISSEDTSAQELNTIEEVIKLIEDIRKEINNLGNLIPNGVNSYYTKQPVNEVICLPNIQAIRDNFDKVYNEYKTNIENLRANVNTKINIGELKLNEDILNKVIIIKGLTKADLTPSELENKIVTYSNGGYSSATDDKVRRLAYDLRDMNKSSLPDGASFDVYVLKEPYNEINNKKRRIEETKKTLTDNLAQTLSSTAIETIGFEPTVRNIFRVLAVNSEIFLDVLRDVSVEAELNAARAQEFKKIQGNVNSSSSINVKPTSETIYPWPEYRKVDKTNAFVETWLGSETSINPLNINEVVFVEELLKEFLNVARFDNELDLLEEVGSDIDQDAIIVKDPWYPLSAADTPTNELLKENPYISEFKDANPDKVKRLMMLRAFMFMGVSAYNNKIPEDLLKIMGKLEAENIVQASRKQGKNGRDTVSTLINGSADKNKLYLGFKKFGLDGSDQIDNPKTGAKPFMDIINEGGQKVSNDTDLSKDITNYYFRYKYISDEEKKGTNQVIIKSAYIPLSGNYDGKIFYNGETVKNPGSLNGISNSTLFVSNPNNINDSKYFKDSDGSYLFNIIDIDTYQGTTMKPDFGGDLTADYETYLGKNGPIIDVSKTYKALVEKRDNEKVTLSGLNPLGGTYSALELNQLNYNNSVNVDFIDYIGEPNWGQPNKENNFVFSSILAFYTQNKREEDSAKPKLGTYLSKVIDNKLESLNADGFKTLYEDNKNDIYYTPELSWSFFNQAYDKTRNTWYNSGSYLKNKTLINSYLSDNSTKLYTPFIEFGVESNKGRYNVSLFGSYLYNIQNDDKAKALLFLHTISWQGVKNFGDDINELMMLDKRIDYGIEETSNKLTTINSIRSLFQGNSAFIHAPKAWILFIGAMLWRIREKSESGKDPIVWSKPYNGINYTYISNPPKTDEFLYTTYTRPGVDDFAEKNTWGMFFSDKSTLGLLDKGEIVPIDKTIRYLPRVVRTKLINYFTEWVNNENGFKFIQRELELFKNGDNIGDWVTKTSTINTKIEETINNPSNTDYSYINRKDLNDLFGENVVKNYSLITRSKNINKSLAGNLFTILKPNTIVMDNIVSLLTKPVILQNNNPNIWNLPENKNTSRDSKDIKVRVDIFKTYIESLYEHLIKLNKDYQSEDIKSEEDVIKQDTFGTTDDNSIKLIIYRTLSNINDKWLNGSEDTGLFNQCGSSGASAKANLNYASRFRTKDLDKTTLIDTFRFVDRAFADIGDEFYININSVTNMLRHNYNQSFFDVANKILSENNFNFFTLPSFINFNDINDLKTVFTPYSYMDEELNSGPTFVCCYVGQTSTNLDLGTDSVYPDDGLSISFDGDKLNVPVEASDFLNPNNNPLDSLVPVFSVNYGQQNQNYFKGVRLDQREFVETMESLQTIEYISQSGDKSKPTYRGNNLFNVYQTRSYSAEIEMLGSAMIQPMMYFQLNNIPMFRGAYLIYKVNHNIKPHNMVTTFKGNRVKKSKSALMDKATMYMNLLGPGTGETVKVGGSRVSGSVLPLVKTLTDNGVSYSNVNVGQIRLKSVPDINGVKFIFGGGDEVKKRQMISEAVEPLTEMIKDWITWMKQPEQNFKGQNGTYLYVTSMFRYLGEASPHSLGIAVDFQFFNKDGIKFSNQEENVNNLQKAFSFKTNPALKWLYNHAYEYGFAQPFWANDGRGIGKSDGEEWWHWEYHGKSAIYIIRKQPIPSAGGNSPSDNPLSEIKESKIKPFVKNPKNPDGSEAIYTGIEYSKVSYSDTKNGIIDDSDYPIKKGSEADYWSLVAICALENRTDQGRCDVAQSIYNRLKSGVYRGSTIKELIVSKNQYQPVNNAIKEFKAIDSKETAIKAVMMSKKWNKDKAKNAIEETQKALKNKDLLTNSKSFIGGRTDFYSTSLKDRTPYNTTLANAAGQNVTRDGQIFGWFVGQGSKKYGNTNPPPANLPNFNDFT
jgi:hypothetical protein